MQLAGKVAVITGGASGIGKGTALAMARQGADIVLADIDRERLEQARDEVTALGRRAVAVVCDVSSDADVERLAATALAQMGQVDLLMNNAGVILRGALEEIPISDWEWAFGINVLGVVRGIRAFLPQMIARRSGYIINTGSVAGLFALTGEGAPYVSSKFAVVGLSESLALYARTFGIYVSVLCPGSVDTRLREHERVVGLNTPERRAAENAAAAAAQGGVLMTPEQIGEAVVEAVAENRFFILPDPYHQPILERRSRDWNAFMAERFSRI